MSTIVSYVKNEFHTFYEKPFSEVDSLVLSWLSYLRFPEAYSKIRMTEGMYPCEIFRAEWMSEMLENVKSHEESGSLLAAVIASPRFREMKWFCYEDQFDKETGKQFAALSFQIPGENDLTYVAFRGTDSTFTGWKEDFNLILSDPVPSQKAALQYLEKVAGLTKGGLLVGGHSKGGNLAVYASANCESGVNDRIQAIYSHDGPGFLQEEVESEAFEWIRNRIHKTVPQSSLIGMIMEQECQYKIIHSFEKSISQHNPFTWEVDDGKFVERTDLTADAKILYRMVNDWSKQYSEEECEQFISVLFDVIEGTGSNSFDEMGGNLKEAIPAIVKEATSMESEKRSFMLRTFGNLVKSGVSIAPGTLIDAVKNEMKEITLIDTVKNEMKEMRK